MRAQPTSAPPLRVEHATSIDSLPADEWDACLGDRGAFSVGGLRFLERLFGPHQPPENRWVFHYYRVVDDARRTLLATFFTEALWKDDMLAPAEVSAAIERRRELDPYYATSKVFSMGSLLTEGSHLFLARAADWRPALDLLLADVRRRALACGAESIVLRDLPAADTELIALLAKQGFTAQPLPPSSVLHLRPWRTEDEFVAPLKNKFRQVLRNKVFRFNSHYSARILSCGSEPPSAQGLDRWYRLYREVHGRSLALNTFPLPEEIFREALRHPGWELLVLDLRPDAGAAAPTTAAVILSFVGRRHYVPIILGLDYRYAPTHAAYRQTLWREILRARELGLERVNMGLGAPIEKARFGCEHIHHVLLHGPTRAG